MPHGVLYVRDALRLPVQPTAGVPASTAALELGAAVAHLTRRSESRSGHSERAVCWFVVSLQVCRAG